LKYLRGKPAAIAGVFITPEEVRRDPRLSERLWRTLAARPARALWLPIDESRALAARAAAVAALYRAAERADC